MPSKRLTTMKKTSIGKPRRGARAAAAAVVQLKVSLNHIEPLIWRRVLATNDLTFAQLHLILQVTMGWQNSHLHEFRLGDRRIGIPDPEFEDEVGTVEDETQVRLAQVRLQPGEKFSYVYDFGDSWTHTILVEKALRVDTRFVYPACVAGARACPPEDCGGPPGYFELLQKLGDPKDDEHDDMLSWIGGVFDPEGFDINRTNAALRVQP